MDSNNVQLTSSGDGRGEAEKIWQQQLSQSLVGSTTVLAALSPSSAAWPCSPCHFIESHTLSHFHHH